MEDTLDSDAEASPNPVSRRNQNIPVREHHSIQEEDHCGYFDSDPGFGIGTTPPRNHREEIRLHSRSRQGPKPPRLVIPKRDSVPKTFNAGTRRSLVRMEKLEDMEAFINPALGSTAMQQKRKSITIERNQQREYKHGPNCGDISDAPGIHVPLPAHSFFDPLPSPIPKVDSNIFFRSLNSQPVSQSPPPSPPVAKTKKHSIGRSHCPDDRIAFHKIFSEMIRIGSAKKDAVSESKNSVLNSQEKNTFQTEWNQLLWLGLKSFQNGITMMEEDQRLIEQRAMIPDILQAILLFKFEASPSTSEGPTRCTLKSRNRVMSSSTEHQGDTGSDSDRSSEPQKGCDTCSTPFLTRRPSADIGLCMPLSAALTNYIQNTRQAWKQITTIIEQLTEAEQLYPTLRALHNDFPLCKIEAFILRIETLCLWLNITSDLSHKIEQAALMLGVMDIEGVFWPGILENESEEEEVESVKTKNETQVSQTVEATVIKPHPRRLFDVQESCSSLDSTDTEDTIIEQKDELKLETKFTALPKKRTRSVTFDLTG